MQGRLHSLRIWLIDLANNLANLTREQLGIHCGAIVEDLRSFSYDCMVEGRDRLDEAQFQWRVEEIGSLATSYEMIMSLWEMLSKRRFLRFNRLSRSWTSTLKRLLVLSLGLSLHGGSLEGMSGWTVMVILFRRMSLTSQPFTSVDHGVPPESK